MMPYNIFATRLLILLILVVHLVTHNLIIHSYGQIPQGRDKRW